MESESEGIVQINVNRETILKNKYPPTSCNAFYCCSIHLQVSSGRNHI